MASAVEHHPLAGALHGDGEVLVFGERVGRKAALFVERAAPPGADRARHDGDALSAASARRSRFCAMIYSSACQRVIMLMRLPTLALPATAPIFWSANQRISCEIVSGWNWVSASSATMISPRARARPVFSAVALPPFGMVISVTRELSSEALAHHAPTSRRSSRRR